MPAHVRELGLAQGADGPRIGRRGQARDRVFLLARDPQRRAAGDDQLELGGRSEELADERCGVDHLLEVVEDEQDPPAGDPLRQLFADRHPALLDEAEDRRDRRADQGRLTNRLEGHEVDAVGERLGDARRELQRQAGLARAARSGQGQQARLGQPGGRVGQLVLAADEGRDLGRQVVGPAVERADRPGIISQPVDLEDRQAFRPEVLEPVLTHVAGPDPGRQAARDEGQGGRRQDHLAAVGSRCDPCGAVDVVADVGPGADHAQAGVQAHPDLDRVDAMGKRAGRQRPLGVDRGRDRRRRRREDDEERVALGADLEPVVGGPGGPEQVAMAVEHVAVGLGPELLDELGRAFDVGEQEGQGATGQDRCRRLGHGCGAGLRGSRSGPASRFEVHRIRC